MGTLSLPIPWADFHRAGHPPAFAYGQPEVCPLCPKLCVCGHAADWHSYEGSRDCEHDGECECCAFLAANSHGDGG